MHKLFEILGKRKVEGDVGIEVECEGANLVRVEEKNWHTEDDGSLRPVGGFPSLKCEWVLDTPIPVNEVRDSLTYLAKRQEKATLNFGFRTSVHVHVNCQDLTYYQLLNMVYIYFLYEEPLINFCGEGRKANRFCLRVRDAEGQLEAIQELMQWGEQGLLKMRPDRTRYSALNLEALPKYGSLEFRGMRGTLDVPTLLSWVNMCVSIREAAKKYEDIEAVHEAFIKLGSEEFGQLVFGKELKKLENVEEGAALGYSLALDIPYAFKEAKKKPYKEYKKPAEAEAKVRAARYVPPPPRQPRVPIDADLMGVELPEIVADIGFAEWQAQLGQKVQEAREQAIAAQAPKRKPRIDDLIILDDVEEL